jgi:hypothetical protein
MEKYAAALKQRLRLDLCDNFSRLGHSPIDSSADTVAHVTFPVEMFIVARLCTCETIKRLGAQEASEPALGGDIGGGYRWGNSQFWRHGSHGRDVHLNVGCGAGRSVGRRGCGLASRYVLCGGLVRRLKEHREQGPIELRRGQRLMFVVPQHSRLVVGQDLVVGLELALGVCPAGQHWISDITGRKSMG